ncbi:MAG: extracellular solute-binding protein [Butyrivibrio sp.]|nr:extracellular solute-binding protein [Butyrivibrio sp.]
MRQRIIKCCALALAAVMTLSACGGGTGDPAAGSSGGQSSGQSSGQTQQITVNKDAVWKSAPMEINAEFDLTELNNGIAFANGIVYLFGEKASGEGENYQHELYMVRCNPDGSNAEKVVLDNPGMAEWYASFTIGEEGEVYAVKTSYPPGMYGGPGPESTGPERPMDEGEAMTEVAEGEVVFEEAPADAGAENEAPADEASGESTDSTEQPADGTDTEFAEGEMERYYIVRFEASGEKTYETQIQPENPDDAAGGFFVNGIRYSHGKIVITDSTGIALINTEDGKRGKTIVEADNYPQLLTSKDGDVYACYWNDEGQVLTEIDAENNKAGEEMLFPDAMLLYDTGTMSPGSDSDFIVTDSTGVSTWNVGDESVTQFLSYIDSDLNIDFFDSLVQVSGTEMIAMYNTPDDGERVISRFTKVQPADVKERETLSLACNYLDRDLRKAVVHFNQTNTEYRIAVQDYSKFNTEGSWDEGYKQLNNDIISGNSPDIMALDSGRYVRIYQSKGLLEPLDSYIQNDPEIGANEYLDSVLDVYRYQGELCLVTPAFMMRTYAVKATDAAQITDWSLETLQRMADERDIDYKMMFGDWPMTNMNMLTTALVFDGKNYFDWDNHLVKFDSKEFIDLLNFSKKFPEEVDFNSAMEQDTSGFFRTGQAIVAQAFFGGFNDFKRLKYGTFGEDVAFVGFPREGGEGGSSALALTQFAMSSESKNKDACWQFLRSYLTDEYQQSVIDELGYAFPVSKKHLEQMAKKSMERQTYTDDNGETQYIDESFFINGEEIKLPPLTQEDVDQVMELFNTVDSAYEYDDTLMNMVQEETTPFFKGQKTAEECAKILQSKAQIYIDENS